jgi:hypothetical protein
MKKQRKPGPWFESKREVGTDTQSGETIYEVREQRILPGGYVETKPNVKRLVRSKAHVDTGKAGARPSLR